jgi:hypothetical protein
MPLSSLLRCLFVLAITAGAGECAAARLGELLVREGNAGVPCFTVSQLEEERAGAPDFHAISVSEIGAKSALWKMTMPAPRTFPVTFRMCIPYAGRVPVLPQTAAAALEGGKLYEVALLARGHRGAIAPREYRGRFCLMPVDGVLRVRNLGINGTRPNCGAGSTP